MRMREIINLVEMGFMAPPMSQPSFGRKGVPEKPRTQQPPPPNMAAEVENAKQYATADEYADAGTWSIYPSNTSPPDHHTRFQQARNNLIAKWNSFRDRGWL